MRFEKIVEVKFGPNGSSNPSPVDIESKVAPVKSKNSKINLVVKVPIIKRHQQIDCPKVVGPIF